MITFVHSGSFKNTERLLRRSRKINLEALKKYGEQGVMALSSATPVNTGKTAMSWDYRITEKEGSVTIDWVNANIVDNVPIAVILQYGHATGTGGYVKGIDYINPAIRPIIQEIADKAWKEVIS